MSEPDFSHLLPEFRVHALLPDAERVVRIRSERWVDQLRSRFIEVELPPWRDGEDLRVFLARLVQSLPLRQPSPVDSRALRRLVATRSAGLTWTICKAFERAAVAAITSGRERLDRSSFEDPETWRGLAIPGRAGVGPGARPGSRTGMPPA